MRDWSLENRSRSLLRGRRRSGLVGGTRAGEVWQVTSPSLVLAIRGDWVIGYRGIGEAECRTGVSGCQQQFYVPLAETSSHGSYCQAYARRSFVDFLESLHAHLMVPVLEKLGINIKSLHFQDTCKLNHYLKFPINEGVACPSVSVGDGS